MDFRVPKGVGIQHFSGFFFKKHGVELLREAMEQLDAGAGKS